MNGNMLRALCGPIMGYDYIRREFSDPEALTAHRVHTLLNGGDVRRFHTRQTIGNDTVAAHSWGVAALCFIMCNVGGKLPSAALLAAALFHDLGEQWTGDVPSPTKRALGIGPQFGEIEDELLEIPQLNVSLSKEEARTLKLADCFDGMMFCIRERRLGNQNVSDIMRRYDRYVMELQPVDVEFHVLYTLRREWEKVNR